MKTGRVITGCLLIAMIFSACWHNESNSVKADITRDTLTYTYQNIREAASDCGNKADTNCTVANINYPVFNNQSALNDTLSRKLSLLFTGDPDKSLQTLAKNFSSSYDAWKKAHKGAKDRFKLKLDAGVVRQDSSLATLQIDGSSLAGNKHPIAFTKFVNWNTKAGAPITLDSIMVKGYADQLNTIAEVIFRKQENLKDTSSLARDYFFKGNKFYVNNNFLITPLGIRFLYNEYEIKPYNAGKTDLFVPYSQLKSLLKPGTVIKRYLK